MFEYAVWVGAVRTVPALGHSIGVVFVQKITALAILTQRSQPVPTNHSFEAIVFSFSLGLPLSIFPFGLVFLLLDVGLETKVQSIFGRDGEG